MFISIAQSHELKSCEQPQSSPPSCVKHFKHQVTEARDAIWARRLWQPSVGIILGSGLGTLADRVEHATTISYSVIPHFSLAHAQGHAGQMVLGYLSGVPVIMMQGRAHRYEGLSNLQARFPVHCMHALGIDTLITTNAAGGLNSRFCTGDLMVIDSHIDFLWTRRLEDAGFIDGERVSAPRTPPYDWSLIKQAKQSACRRGTTLHQGCYLATLGPTYETRSEYRMFRWTGADAVGMSTVPEVLAASSLAVRVLAFSVITNVASTDIPQATTHAEVVESGSRAGPQLMGIIQDILQEKAGYPD